jgi:hypothetical protein
VVLRAIENTGAGSACDAETRPVSHETSRECRITRLMEDAGLPEPCRWAS